MNPIDEGQSARLMSDSCDLGDRGPDAEHIAGRGHRHQPGARAHQLLVLSAVQLAGGRVDQGPADPGPRPLGRLDPGPHVGIVVKLGDHHLITWAPGLAKGI
jgi:hypothetical protein